MDVALDVGMSEEKVEMNTEVVGVDMDTLSVLLPAISDELVLKEDVPLDDNVGSEDDDNDNTLVAKTSAPELVLSAANELVLELGATGVLLTSLVDEDSVTEGNGDKYDEASLLLMSLV